jgi:hypothetical protein
MPPTEEGDTVSTQCKYAVFHESDALDVAACLADIVARKKGSWYDPISRSQLSPGPSTYYVAQRGTDALLFSIYPQIGQWKAVTEALRLTCDWILLSDEIATYAYGRILRGVVNKTLWWDERGERLGVPADLIINDAAAFVDYVQEWFRPPTLLWSFGKLDDIDWYRKTVACAEASDKLDSIVGLMVGVRGVEKVAFRGEWTADAEEQVRGRFMKLRG